MAGMDLLPTILSGPFTSAFCNSNLVCDLPWMDKPIKTFQCWTNYYCLDNEETYDNYATGQGLSAQSLTSAEF